MMPTTCYQNKWGRVDLS